jgi:hypothetical protein
MKSKNYKKFSRLVEISSILQRLREVLLKKGRVLQGLLTVEYPGADVVCSAVGEIHILLDHDDICDVWVSAHDEVDDGGEKNLLGRDVRKVSILLIAHLDCTELHVPNQYFLCLGDIASNPQLRASVFRSFRA